MVTPKEQMMKRSSTLTIREPTDPPKTAKKTIKHVSGKGKAAAYVDGPPRLLPQTSSRPPPPPLDFLNEQRVNTLHESESFDDWLRFKEAGLLDQATMERKHREALLDKETRLVKELFEYQHNLGLVLIENKKLTATVKGLKEALSEVKEAVQRDEAAHLMAVSEANKCEEELRKGLDLEKRCRADLEKALCEIVEENKQVKLNSQTKLVAANKLVAGIQDKSKQVDKKMQEAETKLKDVNTRSLELDRRFQEVETRESTLQRECLYLFQGQENWKLKSCKQKEDLQEWERRLQEGEGRVCEGQRIINQREQKVYEMEMTLKQKEKEVEEAHYNIDHNRSQVKKKEDDVKDKLANLIAKEKEAESLKRNLDMKEKELVDLNEKLNIKETVEIQNLVDEHRQSLDSKIRELDLEMEEKRKSFDENMRSKVEDVNQKEAEVNHWEEKLRKVEQALEKKTERFIEKEKDLDARLNALYEKEKSVEKRIELDQKQMLADKQTLQAIKDNIETINAEITEKELRLKGDIEKLRIAENERSAYFRLQSELKDEIHKCRIQRETLEKEVEDLRKDRMKFEEEWEALNEKENALNKEKRELCEQEEMLENFHKFKKGILEKQKLATENHIKRELEAIKVERESFAAKMKQDQSLLTEKYENEQKQLHHEFEIKERALEVDFQNKHAEIEKQFELKEKAFKDEQEKEIRNINFLKESAKKEMEEIEHQRHRVDKEKDEMSINKKQLEKNQLEMRKDIHNLCVLSKKLKNQREELTNERTRFLAFIEKLKSCGNCGELTRNFELSDMQMLEGSGDSPSRTVDEIIERSESIISGNNESPNSGGLMARFKKFVTSFELSPHRKNITENLHAQSFVTAKGLIDQGSILDETPEESQQSELRNQRKRSRDDNIVDSEVASESVTQGGQKKKKRKLVATPVQNPYFLRSCKTRASADNRKENELNTPGNTNAVGGGDPMVAEEFSEDHTGTNEHSGDNRDDEDNVSDGSEKHPGDMSIGKKLLKFFST